MRKELLVKSFITLITIILLHARSSLAQYYPESHYENTKIDFFKENSLNFNIKTISFFKNNEYFNDILQGYTLFGNSLHSRLQYYPSDKTKLEAGLFLLQYYGLENFTQAIPTFSFQYHVSESVDIVLGSLYGSTNHNVIEPLFRYEYVFTDNIETGLQFLIDKPRYKGDIWINWQDFIFKGEDKQEIFTLGLVNRFYLNDKESKHSISIPAQAIFIHQGGQINDTDEKLITYNNSAIGINYTLNTPESFFKRISLESCFVNFADMSSDYQLPYIQGYGIYSSGDLKVRGFDLRVAHWYSEFYATGRGHPIFGGVSTIWSDHREDQRALISTRLMYEKRILEGLFITAGAEAYFDLYNYYVDYWYMLNINFNRDFFIKKFK